ncbi:MAG TPA: hypothetical protein ENK18_13360 [Deltaproteobacteria bacterium]|nr:hypothetical protein [Deltaproteobacteria bacterium]
MRRLVTSGMFAIWVTGCHAKFKREVGSIDAVQLEIITQSGPSASLGGVAVPVDPTPESDAEAVVDGIAGVAAGVFNLTQAVKAAKISDRLASTIDIDRTNSAMLEGIAAALGHTPFSVVRADQGGDLLQLEVLNWGMQVAGLGNQGRFTYEVRARIYKADGERVYSSRLSCELAAGAPGAEARALNLVNNVKQLDEMSDEQLQESFEAMAGYCGEVFVAQLRKHAG